MYLEDTILLYKLWSIFDFLILFYSLSHVLLHQYFCIQSLLSQSGASIWSADPTVTNNSWNFYQPQVVPDLDGDGVPDVVASHGGNGDYKAIVSLPRNVGTISSCTRLRWWWCTWSSCWTRRLVFLFLTTVQSPIWACYVMYMPASPFVLVYMQKKINCHQTEEIKEKLKEEPHTKCPQFVD